MSKQAAKQRRYRQRVARGVAVYRVPASDDVLLALITSGRITEQQGLDKQQVERAMSNIMLEWALKYFVTSNA